MHRTSRPASVFAVAVGLIMLAAATMACGAQDASIPPSDPSQSASANETDAAPSGDGEPRQGGSLHVAFSADPVNLGPVTITGGDPSGSKIVNSIYDELIEYDFETGELRPGLATSWEQIDELTWEFQLREGVQFHKGYGEFTADDVAFQVNYIIENESPPSANFYTFVESAEVVDTYRVRYNLTAPYAPFLLTTATGTAGKIMSRDAFEEKGPELFTRDPVGTGPFEFTEWVTGDRVVLSRFDEYWDADNVYLDEIVFQVVPDASTAEGLLRTGAVQLVDTPIYANVDTLAEADGIQVLSTPIWGSDYIGINVTREPFNLQEVRDAISLAIDRQVLADGVFFGQAAPDDDVLTPNFMAKDDEREARVTADIEEAQRLLDSVGLADGFTATMIVRQAEENVRAAQIIRDQLSQIGVDLEITPADTATFNTATLNTGAEMAYDMQYRDFTFVTADADSPFFNFVRTDSLLSFGYSNPTVDQLLVDARAETDFDTRVEMYQELNAIVLEEKPNIYLLHRNIVRPASEALHGYQPEPKSVSMYFKGVWLEE